MKRLREDQDSFLRDLVRSADGDAPSPAVVDRALKTAQGGAGIATPLVVVVGVGIVVAIGAFVMSRPSETPVARPTPSAIVTTPPAASSVAAPITTEVVPEVSVADLPIAPKPPVVDTPTSSADDVMREISEIDRARTALSEHRPADSLRILDAYRTSFPRGTLREDAEAVRIETLVALGRTKDARDAADAFARQFPNSTHAQHIHNVLASDGG